MYKRRVGAVLTLALAIGSIAFLQAQHIKSKSALSADDYVEIQQLYARYNVAIDSGDAEGWAATFVPDGTFNTFTGHDALVGFVKTWRETRNGANRRHWNTNLVITPSAEGATGSVYLFLMDTSVTPPVVASASTYADQLVRTPQGWRFKKRTTTPVTPAPKP